MLIYRVPCRGETGVGNWTVIVKDTQVNEFSGRFLDWQLSLWGEAIDGKIQKLHPLPDVHDHDHDTSESASLVATTTISTASTSKTAAPEKPTNHVDRPINAKPTSPTGTAGAAAATSSANSTSIPITDNLLPSPFPSFGVSKVTQIWIYGSVALIFIFCVALGIYFVVQRRKRLRNTPRDDYEFEMVAEDEEGYPLSGAGAGGIVGGRKQSQRRRRGGELYDAFAGESDEEIFSESEAGEKPYYDHEDGDDDDEGRADGVDGQQRTRDDGQAVWSEKSRGSGEPGTGS